MNCDQCKVALADGYAIDPIPGGWGGHYCTPCKERLRFQWVDLYNRPRKQ